MMVRINWLAAGALSLGLCSSALAQIAGAVKLSGTPPEMPEITAIKNLPDCAKMHKDPVYEETVLVGDNGELDNVVVSIKPAAGQRLKGDIPKTPATIDQKACMYRPHVVACMIGQDFVVKNSDEFLHNVHALCFDNDPFNFGQPAPGEKKLAPFTVAENFKIKCDVHPWMSAWICVFDHPYFGVTGEDGKYSIDTKGLPDGDYTLDAWQEKYGEQTQKITVKDGKATADFTFKSDEKTQANPIRPRHPVS
jgi:plastocyanin